MRKTFFVLAALILELFMFQNVHSEEEPRTVRLGDHSTRRYVLWRVYTQQPDSNGIMQATVDSVLREEFQTKEKFKLSSNLEEVKNLTPNAYYLVLGIAGCSGYEAAGGRCFLTIVKGKHQTGKRDDYVLPDNPENRAFLDKKWRETEVKYDPPSRCGLGCPILESREKSNSVK